ncbi:MAG: hypothetical protein DCC49_06590 [Acidobacteria bacterium]|nr:MAG: hypothetical protein DCC49_06590 [Acidobacteriota bacterium]
MAARRSRTSTYNFGASRRESHDASPFYQRFTTPDIAADARVNPPSAVDRLICADASAMTDVADNSVALVVTSPPYFAGKEYEEALGRGDTPATYLEYLEMLESVFAECSRVLEPGGRIAVNVANLGRKPYRSLSADVTAILQDRLKLLLRGEVVWVKARGSTGSCAWGTFQRPTNPVLRDLTERVIIAGKGRFDRAVSAKERHERHMPCDSSLSRDEFMEATTDLWEIPPESATRVGHPAPFPVGLPVRLINLYTYCGDLVLDPFAGSGTTAIAALRTGRHYIGYDTDAGYIELAEARVAEERRRLESGGGDDHEDRRFFLPAIPDDGKDQPDSLAGNAAAISQGAGAKQVAGEMLEASGFRKIQRDVKVKAGIEVAFSAEDASGTTWHFEVCGGFTSVRPGLLRGDILWKALGTACVLHQVAPDVPLVLLTTGVPKPGSAGHRALFEVVGPGSPIFSVIEIDSTSGHEALSLLARGAGQRGGRGDAKAVRS